MTNRIRRRSIRSRLTLWYSVFTAILFILLVMAMLLWQSLFSRDFYQKRLESAIAVAAESLVISEDGIRFAPELSIEGVHTSVLDADGEVLLGRTNYGIAPREYRLRTSQQRDGGTWYLLDHAIELDGVQYWVRCSTSSAVTNYAARTLLLALLACVPVLLLIIVFGGSLITRRVLLSLNEITSTAENISDSVDLKQRIPFEGQTNEVGRLAHAFNNMFDRLQRSMDREKRFISDASHELRTPLSVISAQSEFALSPGRTQEEKDAALTVIHARSELAGQMLGQMLLLSRMDSQRVPLHRERLSLSDLLMGVAEELRADAGERNIEVLCLAEPDVCVDGDELLLIRMLTNLIQNAIHYGRSGGHIWLELQRMNDRAILRVRDDGIGIADAEKDKIWQRFYQVHKANESGRGSGLGLPIVRWIVEAHGGTISLESEIDHGSTFEVELPI